MAVVGRRAPASDEILVAARRFFATEMHADDLVAGSLRAVPGAMQRHEGIAMIFRRKYIAIVKCQAESGGVRLDQNIRNHSLADRIAVTRILRVGMRPDISVRPSVEGAGAH